MSLLVEYHIECDVCKTTIYEDRYILDADTPIPTPKKQMRWRNGHICEHCLAQVEHVISELQFRRKHG
jgi:hypothetical protein